MSEISETDVKKRKTGFTKMSSLRSLNVLGLLSFCLAFALAVNRSGERALIVHNFFVGVNAAVVMMIEWVIQ